MTKSGMTLEFQYDHNGLRTQKKITQNGVTTTTNYALHGKLVTHMTVGADTLHFFYDAQSRPTKVNFNGTIYTYLHNLQGDIVGIVDGNGNLVVEYNYGAWGKPLSTIGTKAATLGKLNPFRYRGYVYDEESGLYYTRSRYYVANQGRFLNADCVDILVDTVGQFCGSNQYQYCKNAYPISADEDGKWLNVLIGTVAGAVISAGCQLASNYVQGKDLTDGLLTATVSGAITGGVAASGVGLAGQIIVGAAVGAGAEYAQQMIDNNGDIDPLTCFVDCAIAAGFGALGGWYGGHGLVNRNGSAYKEGMRVLKVISNIDDGVYKSASKALSRLTSVAKQYAKEYSKQALVTTAKYTVAAVATTALKPIAQRTTRNVGGWIGGISHRLYSTVAVT